MIIVDRLIFSQLIIVGLITILGQVVILRELEAAFYGIELVYILGIGGWLLFTATGAFCGRRDFIPSPALSAIIFLLFGLLLPLEIAGIRYIQFVFSGIAGTYLPLGQQVLALAMVLLPIGFLGGLLFQWNAKRYCRAGGSLAHAYAIESLGGIAGGLMSALLFSAGTSNMDAGIICAITAIIMAVFSAEQPVIGFVRQKKFLLSALLIAGLSVWLNLSAKLDHYMTGWKYPGQLLSHDSPYGRLTVVKHQEQIIIYENGSLRFDSQSLEAELLAHLAAIRHPDPQNILICGSGITGLPREIQQHLPRNIDYLEVNQDLIALLKDYLPEHFGIDSGSLNISHKDPRLFLKTAGQYDIIFLAAPPPDSGYANRFYTVEFFQECRKRLTPEGILAFQLPSSENLWSSFMLQRNASIYQALNAVFPRIDVLPGDTDIYLAGNALLGTDLETMITRYIQRGIVTHSITPAYIEYFYTHERFFRTKEKLAGTTDVINTETEPAGYRYSILLFLSKFMRLDQAMEKMPSGINIAVTLSVCFAILGVLFRAAASYISQLSGVVQVLIASLISMIMESVLILNYQIQCGVLFQDIGILLMMFMAGLAVGSLTVAYYLEQQQTNAGFSPNRCAGYLFLGFMPVNIGILLSVYFGLANNLLLTSVMLFITGFLSSGIFAKAAWTTAGQNSVSRLYAADMLGGCLGAPAAALFLIPFAGPVYSVLLLMIIALITAALISL